MKRIFLIILVSLMVSLAFVVLKYATFGMIMPKANYGMRAICQRDDITDLYLGSSMFRQGIATKELGDSTYLLAYNSNRPFLEAMQLENLLKKGAKFKRLVVDMYPYSITRGVGISDVRMIMDGDLRFTFDVFFGMHKSGEGVGTLLDLLFQQNNEIFLTFPISCRLMNSRYDRGSNTSNRHGKTEAELAELSPKEVDSEEMNTYQVDGLEKIINVCRENGIDLVFLETPKYQIINNDWLYVKLMREFAQFLSERDVEMILFDKTFQKVADVVKADHVKAYRFDDANPMYYLDLYHISYEGRQELSKILVDFLG